MRLVNILCLINRLWIIGDFTILNIADPDRFTEAC
jgi:hypothetical protein